MFNLFLTFNTKSLFLSRWEYRWCFWNRSGDRKHSCVWCIRHNFRRSSITSQWKPQIRAFHSAVPFAPVTIAVKAVEFTPPRFSSEEYIAEISEAVPPGSPALSVSASCPSSVLYRISDGDPNGMFHININSGLLSVRSALDFEQHTSYRLTIRATNTGQESHLMQVVYIYVIDDKWQLPLFSIRTLIMGKLVSLSAPTNSMVTGENNTPLVIKASDSG